jgi:hypothetical protein
MRMGKLRSGEWYAGDDRNAYLHRAWMRRGLPSNAFQGRPQIAIANTASDLTPCNAHLRQIAEHVKRGVREPLPAADLAIVARRPHEPSVKEASLWVSFYVALALIFDTFFNVLGRLTTSRGIRD